VKFLDQICCDSFSKTSLLNGEISNRSGSMSLGLLDCLWTRQRFERSANKYS